MSKKNPHMRTSTTRMPRQWKLLSSLNASTEVLAVLTVGAALTGLILDAVLSPRLKAYTGMPSSETTNTYLLAGMTAFEQLVEFTLYLVPAFVLGRLRYRSPAHAYRLTLNGVPLFRLVFIGVLLYCVASLPTAATHLAHHYVNFGEGARHWHYTQELPRNFGYLLFNLAANLVLPPLFEETFFRGYVLTRWSSVFGPAAAILLCSLFFCLVHTQYLIADSYANAILLTTFFQTVSYGYVAYRTGSLLPPIVAHSLANSPFNAPFEGYLHLNQASIVVMLVVVFVYRRAVVDYARSFLGLFRSADFSVRQLVLGSLVIAAALLPETLGGTSAGRVATGVCLGVALTTAIVLRRQRQRAGAPLSD
jgi:membrane protease YdiL (CAAX protease family)